MELHRKQSRLRWVRVGIILETPFLNKTQSWEGSSLFSLHLFVTNKNKTCQYEGKQPQNPYWRKREREKERKELNPFSLSVDSDVTNKQTYILYIYIYIYLSFFIYTKLPHSKIHRALMLSWLQLKQLLYFSFVFIHFFWISFLNSKLPNSSNPYIKKEQSVCLNSIFGTSF